MSGRQVIQTHCCKEPLWGVRSQVLTPFPYFIAVGGLVSHFASLCQFLCLWLELHQLLPMPLLASCSIVLWLIWPQERSVRDGETQTWRQRFLIGWASGGHKSLGAWCKHVCVCVCTILMNRNFFLSPSDSLKPLWLSTPHPHGWELCIVEEGDNEGSNWWKFLCKNNLGWPLSQGRV